jgi:hypothetical protein
MMIHLLFLEPAVVEQQPSYPNSKNTHRPVLPADDASLLLRGVARNVFRKNADQPRFLI